MTVVYNFVFIMFAIAYFPYLVFTGRWHKDFRQRFGILPQGPLDALRGKDIIWVHAVSVGEVTAVKSFCDELIKRHPSKKVLISTVTRTGNTVAKKLFKNRAEYVYLPLDLSWIVNSVLNKIRPRVFVIVETEIWPNLTTALFKKDIPVILINGRISQGSFKSYKKIKFFMKPVLRKIRLFCMQEENYAERIKLMGAEPEKIVVTGNMKFDSAVNAVSGVEALSVKAELGLAKDEDVFIAGSTHPGEDEVVLDVYKKLKEHFKNLRLIIAPRHIERAGNVEALARKMGLMPARVSGHKSQKGSVLILDIMGKLAELYSVATIVFMGGSLIPKGGQNILEPAIFGKPILFGPNMFNFSSVTNFFLERSAARMVGTKDELFSASKELLADFEKRRELGENAKRAVGENLGAAQRNLEKIERYL